MYILLDNVTQMVEVSLYNLRIMSDSETKVNAISATLSANNYKTSALYALLEAYQDAFKEPEGLPPSRPQNHSIPLKKGSQAINLIPYRYLGIQKGWWRSWLQRCLNQVYYNLAKVLLLFQWCQSRRKIIHGGSVWTIELLIR